MPTNPDNGQIITTNGLGINEIDALQLPRNAQLGPSRTAQERKQLRTMMYQQRLAVNTLIDEEIVNNPVIEELVDLVDALSLQVDNTKTRVRLTEDSSSSSVSMPIFAIDRVEDESFDPYYHYIEYYMPFRIVHGDLGTAVADTVVVDFNGDTQAHSLTCSVTWTDVTKAPQLIFDDTTDDVVTFNINSDDGNFFGIVHITGAVAAVAEQVVISVSINAGGDDSPLVIMRSPSYVTSRLTTNVLA